jgi:hypothetical protein
LSGELEEKFIRPIVNAAYPATLAGLDLAVLQFAANPTALLKYTFLVGAISFLFSAFSIFSYTIYPSRKKVWTVTALTFLSGLVCSILATLLLFIPALSTCPNPTVQC